MRANLAARSLTHMSDSGPGLYVQLEYGFEGSSTERMSSLMLFVADGDVVDPFRVVHIDLTDLRDCKGEKFERASPAFLAPDSSVAIPELFVPFPASERLPRDIRLFVGATLETANADGLLTYRSGGSALLHIPPSGSGDSGLRSDPRSDPYTGQFTLRTASGDGETAEKGLLYVRSMKRNTEAEAVANLAPPEKKFEMIQANCAGITDYVDGVSDAAWKTVIDMAADPESGGDAPRFIKRNQFPSYPRHLGFPCARAANIPMALYLHSPGPTRMGPGCALSLLRFVLWRHGLEEGWWVSVIRGALDSGAGRSSPACTPELSHALCILAEAAAVVPSTLPYVEDEVDTNRDRMTWSESRVKHCEVVGKFLNTMGNDCEDAAAAAVDAWLSFAALVSTDPASTTATTETERLMGRVASMFVPVSVLGLARSASAASMRQNRSVKARIRDRSLTLEDVFGHKWCAILSVPHLERLLSRAVNAADVGFSLRSSAPPHEPHPAWLQSVVPMMAEGTGPTWPMVVASAATAVPVSVEDQVSASLDRCIVACDSGRFLSSACSTYGKVSLDGPERYCDFYVDFTVLDLPPHRLLRDGRTGSRVCQIVLGSGRDASGNIFMGLPTHRFLDPSCAGVEVSVSFCASPETYARITRIMNFVERPSTPILAAGDARAASAGYTLPWGKSGPCFAARNDEAERLVRSAVSAASGPGAVRIRERAEKMGGGAPQPRKCRFYIPLSSFHQDTPCGRINAGRLEKVLRNCAARGWSASADVASPFAGHSVVALDLYPPARYT